MRTSQVEFASVEKIYRECSRYGPVVDLIGGEPLLYRRMGDVLRLAGAWGGSRQTV